MTLAAPSSYQICIRSVSSTLICLFDSTSYPKVRTPIGLICLWSVEAKQRFGPKSAKIHRSSEFQKSELRTQIDFWAACSCLWTRNKSSTGKIGPNGVLGVPT